MAGPMRASQRIPREANPKLMHKRFQRALRKLTSLLCGEPKFIPRNYALITCTGSQQVKYVTLYQSQWTAA
jgi:hypothetical protein